MPRPMFPALSAAQMSGRAVACVAALVLAGCAQGTPDPGLPTVGAAASTCADRVDTAKAQVVVGHSVAALRELTTFTPTEPVGECALLDDGGGAELSVQVIHDPQGKALAAELKKLGEQSGYSGDDHSGVSGDGRTTTALWAMDATHYVRVLGLEGASQEQRDGALALAEDVAKRTAAIR